MASKQKDPSSTPSKKHKSTSSTGAGMLGQGLKSLFYGIAGALIYFLFNHILLFTPPSSQDFNLVMAGMSGLLAVGCSTPGFRNHLNLLAPFGLGLIAVQLIVTVALTFSWIASNPFWNFISGSLAIPIGIIWFFILKNKAVPEEPTPEFVYPVKPLFASWTIKLLALLVLLICGVLLFYRLGYYDIWEDENMVINAAIGIQKEGLSYVAEGYDRVWAHSLLISWVFDLFGVSEFNGRLPSAIFGLIFVLTSYYVFTRTYGKPYLAILLPLVCMMNDRFLILFRYMRMYALLIPIFLLAVYILYRTVTIKNKAIYFRGKEINMIKSKILYIAGSIFMLLLLAHLHKLAMIILPVFFVFIIFLVIYFRTKALIYFLFISLGVALVLMFLSFGLELDSLRMFRQVAAAITSKHSTYPEYYRYVLDNGLPINSVMMTMVGGLGLLRSRVSISVKSILGISYLLISISLLFMIYLIGSEGQDYRYVAHIVPFVVGIILIAWYKTGQIYFPKYAVWILPVILCISALTLKEDYRRVYVSHPWAPSYSIVYKTLKDKYRTGDALFAQNVKTYYLDPVKLAGNLYYKVPNRKQYTLDQFKRDVALAQRGWVMWDVHKVYHWREDVITYIYKNFKPYHGGPIDKLGVELWYFDEKVLSKDNSE